MHYLRISSTNVYNEFEVSYLCIIQSRPIYYIFLRERCIDWLHNRHEDWLTLDMIGWACAQPLPTLATPLTGSYFMANNINTAAKKHVVLFSLCETSTYKIIHSVVTLEQPT